MSRNKQQIRMSSVPHAHLVAPKPAKEEETPKMVRMLRVRDLAAVGASWSVVNLVLMMFGVSGVDWGDVLEPLFVAMVIFSTVDKHDVKM